MHQFAGLMYPVILPVDIFDLFGGSNFKNATSNRLSGLLDLLHLLADSRPGGLIATLSLVDVGFDLGN